MNVPVSQAAQARAKWQEAMNSEILIVRCRDEVGEMHKNKLGSGGRGKCIKVGALPDQGDFHLFHRRGGRILGVVLSSATCHS